MTHGHAVNAEPKGVPMNASKPVAEICLYGTRQTGAGYILAIHVSGLIELTIHAVRAKLWAGNRAILNTEQELDIVRLGTGEPKSGRTFTEAVFIAAGLLNVSGVTSGIVHVYEPTGHKFAAFDLAKHIPCFGDLKWSDGGTAYIISAETVAAAAAL